MATVASLVANPILLRNPHPKSFLASPNYLYPKSKFSDSRYAPTVSFSSSSFSSSFSSPKLSANQYRLGISRHGSLCMPPNAHLGTGKPLGRIGGKKTLNPTNPYTTSSVPISPMAWTEALALFVFAFTLFFVCFEKWSLWVKALVMTLTAALEYLFVRWVGETTVVSLQLCFSGKARDLGCHLNQIAETADTSSSTGLDNVVNDTAIALLRHIEYYSSGSISVVSTYGIRQLNFHFDQLSMDERIKNKETLVNVNNVKFQSPTSQHSAIDQYNDDIMVAVFVGVETKLKFPAIHNKYDLQNVLHKLGSIGSFGVLKAVEVLWTPQISSCLAATTT